MSKESREEFEVWARSDTSPINTDVPWDAEIMEAMRAAWQASHKVALEKAANEAKEHRSGTYIASLIRSLK